MEAMGSDGDISHSLRRGGICSMYMKVMGSDGDITASVVWYSTEPIPSLHLLVKTRIRYEL
jgi:hypothetical protein